MTAPAALNEPVHLDFRGTALQWFGWMLLSMAAALLVVPLAWVTAAIARWVCRNTTFSDGTTVEFRGTGGEVVVWHVLYILIVMGQQFLLREVGGQGVAATVVVLFAGNVLQLYILLMLIEWFIYNVKISPGPALSFAGSYLGLLGWGLLVAVLALTIVGWSWGIAAMYRWMAENVKGRGLRFEFHAKGHEILWRMLVVVLGSVVIVTIPMLTLWLHRWLVRNIILVHVEENEWLSEPSESRAKPKPSSPGPRTPVLPID